MATDTTVVWLVPLITALPTAVTEEAGVLSHGKHVNDTAIHMFIHMCLSYGCPWYVCLFHIPDPL